MTTDFNSFDESRLGGFEESPAWMRNLGFISVPPGQSVLPLFFFITYSFRLVILGELTHLNEFGGYTLERFTTREGSYSDSQQFDDDISFLRSELSLSATAQWDRRNWFRPNWVIVLGHVFEDSLWEEMMIPASQIRISHPVVPLLGDFDQPGIPIVYQRIAPEVIGRFEYEAARHRFFDQYSWNSGIVDGFISSINASYPLQQLWIDTTRGQFRLMYGGIADQAYNTDTDLLQQGVDPGPPDIAGGINVVPGPTESFLQRPINQPAVNQTWLLNFEAQYRSRVPANMFFNRFTPTTERVGFDWPRRAALAIREQRILIP